MRRKESKESYAGSIYALYFIEHLMISEHSRAQREDYQVERNI